LGDALLSPAATDRVKSDAIVQTDTIAEPGETGCMTLLL